MVTRMHTITGMNTETQPAAPAPTLALNQHSFLQLMWLASPALPIGGFSYSEGLEAAINAALVTTEKEASSWLVQQLHLTQSRGDMAVIAQAVAAWQQHDLHRVVIVSDPQHMARALRISRELGIQAVGSPTPTSRFRTFATRWRFLAAEVYFFHRDRLPR